MNQEERELARDLLHNEITRLQARVDELEAANMEKYRKIAKQEA